MREMSNTTQNCSPGIKITMPWRIKKISVHPQFRLEVTFLDGLHGYVDLKPMIFSDKAGVFAKLRDLKLFNQAYVELGAVTWPGELDLAPDAMYDVIKTQGEWVLS